MKKILLYLLLLLPFYSYGKVLKDEPDKTYTIIIKKVVSRDPTVKGYPIETDSVITTPPLLSKAYAIEYAKLFTYTQIFYVKKVQYTIKSTSKVK